VDESPEYIELDIGQDKEENKDRVKTFALKSNEDTNPILNSLREGYTIAIIDIKILKSKDVVELKRVISKIKKTIEALEGSIAGFGENTVIATPSFAKIEKGASEQEKPKEEIERF
jgi:SepF-like predicted cell division protein (DUF552 family)